MKLNLLSFLLSSLFTLQYYSQTKPTRTLTIHSEGRVASIVMSDYNDWVKENYYSNFDKRTELCKEIIYKKFKDNFDFIFLILNEDNVPDEKNDEGKRSIQYAGQFHNVSNNIEGIGLNKANHLNKYYGSAGKLQGIMQLTARNFIKFGPSLHELAHNWANFVIDTQYEAAVSRDSHWNFTGGNTKGQLGGFLQSSLKVEVVNNVNTYTVNSFGFNANGANSVPYNDLELYLMGMIPASSVSTFDVFTDLKTFTNNKAEKTYTFTGTRTTYTSANLTSRFGGSRNPSSTTSQKDFKLLIVVLTPAALTNDQWTLVNQHAEEFTRVGDNGNSTYNFYEATRGIGTLTTGNLNAAVLGIDENELTGIAVYPNPAKSSINIKSQNKAIHRIALTNVLGQKVLVKTFNTPRLAYSFDTSYFNPGVYVLEIFSDNNEKMTKKMILN